MAKRILLTGMSGVGKSTLTQILAQRGYRAVDVDAPDWSEYRADGEWVWRETKVQDLIDSLAEDEILFLSGCAINQGQFYPHFDKIVLLSAPVDVITERIQTRTTNSYGKDPAEMAEILSNIAEIEPLLRKGADLEIDTSIALNEVVSTVLDLLDAS